MNFVKFDNFLIDRKEVIKQLSKSRRPRKKPNEKLDQKITEMMALAQELIEPQSVYNIYNVNELPDKPYFEKAMEVGFAICTIGEGLPNKVDEFLKSGELVYAVILDAIGSVAADTVADYTNEIIDELAEKKNLIASMRYSPGYCDAPINDQMLIFSKLGKTETDKLGVQLTDSYMMNPVKSVSFAINIGLTFVNRCRACTKDNCPHRR